MRLLAFLKRRSSGSAQTVQDRERQRRDLRRNPNYDGHGAPRVEPRPNRFDAGPGG